MLNTILKNMNLLVNGIGQAGNIETLTLPVLETTTEDFRGGGLDVAVPVDMGMEPMEATFELTSMDPDVLENYGLQADKYRSVTFRGAIEDEIDNTVKAVVAEMTGMFKMVDHGDWAPGTKATLTFTISLVYYKLTVDTRVVYEIDVLNMKRIIGGVDQLANRRAALNM